MLEDNHPMQEQFRDCLAYFEAFRRLGFPADDIYFVSDPRAFGMMLRTQGKEFIALVGNFAGETTRDELEANWQKAIAEWKAMDDRRRLEIWRESFVAHNSAAMLLAMRAKGISWCGKAFKESQ